KGVFPNKPCFEWPSFSPDGELLISSIPGEHRLVNTATGEVKTVLKEGEGIPRRGVFSADNKLVAIAGRENKVRVWDTASGKLLHTFEGHTAGMWQSIHALTFSRDGKFLASGGDEGRTRIWDLTTGKERFLVDGHTAAVTSVCFHPEGAVLASAGFDHTIRFWNLTTLKSSELIRTHFGNIYDLAWNPK